MVYQEEEKSTQRDVVTHNFHIMAVLNLENGRSIIIATNND